MKALTRSHPHPVPTAEAGTQVREAPHCWSWKTVQTERRPQQVWLPSQTSRCDHNRCLTTRFIYLMLANVVSVTSQRQTEAKNLFYFCGNFSITGSQKIVGFYSEKPQHLLWSSWLYLPLLFLIWMRSRSKNVMTPNGWLPHCYKWEEFLEQFLYIYIPTTTVTTCACVSPWLIGGRCLNHTHPVFVGTGTWVTCHIGPWQSPERFKERHVSNSIKQINNYTRTSCFC